MKETVLRSDLSGNIISNGDGAQVTIRYDDARKGTIVIDVLAHEVEDWAEKGRKQKRRGRKAQI
jgi:hypothetical protein